MNKKDGGYRRGIRRFLWVRGFFDSLALTQNDRIHGLCVHGCVYSFSKQKPLGIDFLKKNDTERCPID